MKDVQNQAFILVPKLSLQCCIQQLLSILISIQKLWNLAAGHLFLTKRSCMIMLYDYKNFIHFLFGSCSCICIRMEWKKKKETKPTKHKERNGLTTCAYHMNDTWNKQHYTKHKYVHKLIDLKEKREVKEMVHITEYIWVWVYISVVKNIVKHK